MSILFTVPGLGAVCSMLCEPGAGMRAHRSHAADLHQMPADIQAAPHHAHSAGDHSAVAQRHHAAPPATVANASHPSAEWNGRCCDQPTLTLTAVPFVRQQLQIDSAVFDSAFIVLSGSDARPEDLSRDTARAPSLPRHTNPVLRI
jgi:hypothetical protein